MKKFLFAMVAIAGSLLAAPAAQAGFLYVDIVSGASSLHVVDGGVGDTDGVVNNSINVDSALLASTFTSITGQSTVTASSNQFSALADGLSRLSAGFTLIGRNVAADFTITAGQTGFTVPGDPKQVDTSGGFVFTNSGVAGNGTFQGFIGEDNAVYPGGTQTPDTLISATSTGNLPNFGGGNGTGFVFNNGNNPYSMTEVLTAHLVKTKNVVIQGQGTTIVSAAVPEPATIVLLATMVGPLAIGLYRRRRTAK